MNNNPHLPDNDLPTEPAPEQDEFVWGDDAFATQEEAEEAIASSLAEDLNNNSDYATVVHGNTSYLIEITVKLVSGENIEGEEEVEAAPEGEGGERAPGPAVEPLPPAREHFGYEESKRSAASRMVDQLLS